MMTAPTVPWSDALVAAANRHVRNVFCPTGAGGGVDPSCSPGGSSGRPSREEYMAQAMANLQRTSRTASGQGVDTSASKEKAEKVVAGLTAESAAQKATDNFRAAFARAYDAATGPAVRAEDVTALADSINATVNAGITREGTLLRTDDSAKFPYTAVAHLGAAREQFAREFADRLADPHADPRETAAWVEWRVNLTDHAYADGVGKTSKALAAIPLVRAGLSLPDYPDNKEFFKRAPTERRVPDAAGKNYRGPDWDGFRDWYKGLVPTSARNAFCPTGEGGGIDPSCSPHGAAKGERTRMLTTLRQTGGFTFVAGQDKYQRIGQSGYAVSPYPDRSAVFDHKVTRGDVRQFMERNRDLLTQPGHAVGAWRDPESGKTYLDVSIVTEDRDHAVSLGRQHNQISIFDFKSGNTIDTGGTGEKQAHNAARPGRDGRRDRPGAGRSVRPVRRLDPTRTGQLRQAFARELRKRFRKIKGDVYQFVVTDDHLGLAANVTTNAPTVGAGVPGRFSFTTDPEKLAAFRDWLRQRFQSELLGRSDRELWQRYVAEGFRRGAGRAFDDAKRADVVATTAVRGEDYAAGGRDEFLRSAFGRPETAEKAKLLAARSFDDLKNVTEDVATKMGRVLTDGLVAGENPRQIAADLDDVLDIGAARAELIARTEIIRAHAEGQLDAFDRLGVTELGVEVEWSTAGDDRVCPECEDMDGKTFSVAEAHGMIPLHPNCRCAFIPAGEPLLTENRLTGNGATRRSAATLPPPPDADNAALLEFSRLLSHGGVP
jgi:SPP1 gp7 family putative phage head morphogenesis protein